MGVLSRECARALTVTRMTIDSKERGNVDV